MDTKRVMIGMSGGVDSSVAAYLLQKEGLEVIGVTMKLFDNSDIDVLPDKACCSLEDAEDSVETVCKAHRLTAAPDSCVP